MRTIQKVATIFSYVNLFLGLTGFIGPLVRGNNDRMFNTRPGLQFGFAATNGVHSLVHTLLGAVGMIPAVWQRYPRAYVSALTGFYALMATMGWARFGNRDGIHMNMGMAVNRYDNIIHTVWAAIGLLFSLQPNILNRLPTRSELGDAAERTRDRFEEKVTPMREKMPV